MLLSTRPTLEDGVSQDVHKKNLDIEVLRAFAVTITIVSHSGHLLFWGPRSLEWLQQNFGLWSGVDLFFAISGFVIARGLHDSLMFADNGAVRMRILCAFWIRRVHRIMPSAFLWLGVGLLLTIVFNRSGAFGGLQGNLVDATAAIVQFADIHYYQCLGPGPDTCGTTRLFGPYWSLSLEEKFYIVLPIAMIVLRSRFRLFAAMLIVLQLVIPRYTNQLLWFLRTDAFLLGALIALARGREVHRILEPKFIGSSFAPKIIPLLLLVMVVGVVTPHVVVPNFTGVLALVCAALVWLASYGCGYIIGRGWLRSLVSWIGLRSYAMYLIHMPAFYLTREIWLRVEGDNAAIGGSSTVRFILTALAFIVVAADLNYRFVEKPIRRKGAEISSRILNRDREPAHPAHQA